MGLIVCRNIMPLTLKQKMGCLTEGFIAHPYYEMYRFLKP